MKNNPSFGLGITLNSSRPLILDTPVTIQFIINGAEVTWTGLAQTAPEDSIH